ncbi:hypothetical protein CPU12_08270 [Malaciobacter molluscorum LMG 25693]|uniref:Membrane protein n=1 Tax=Malaciobacter molluscorum LMG 25693 TaxID=870501 RepID=A0A2G1DHF7_9BACT|nr:TPM domain-containing protein [Malaciobacter molluscorum]AXX93669.1 putative membrane protein [Malaciobacter molluscorum LMG 25693]PHO17921.1 hypothetical protein CPU12_08270 [Malaciobacter molluscorum LMG 25693]RXJ93654.1 hypothetical protein CRV00_10390 [Malaciobacter molluscorum]
MYINENEKNLISKEIENLEKKSSVELVAVIAKKSSNYKYEGLLVSLAITALMSIIAIFLQMNNKIFFQLQILTFTLSYLLIYRFENITLLFLSKKYKQEKASNKAKREFNFLGINNTKTKQGIMFYVSIDEKYVKIITDEQIQKKIPNEYWQDIINTFIIDIKNNQFSKGYLNAIKSSSNRLITDFPIQKNDINELSNEVIEL